MNDKKLRFLPRNKSLKPYSTYLRNNATKEENHLCYDFLKSYPIQFNRQRIISGFIVDFYCDKAKLVIELDGKQHENAKEYDRERSLVFAKYNLVVLRYKNIDINDRFKAVCEEIDKVVQKRLRQFEKYKQQF